MKGFRQNFRVVGQRLRSCATWVQKSRLVSATDTENGDGGDLLVCQS